MGNQSQHVFSYSFPPLGAPIYLLSAFPCLCPRKLTSRLDSLTLAPLPLTSEGVWSVGGTANWSAGRERGWGVCSLSALLCRSSEDGCFLRLQILPCSPTHPFPFLLQAEMTRVPHGYQPQGDSPVLAGSHNPAHSSVDALL